METQICNKCGVDKPLSEYGFRKEKGYHRRICKECSNKKTKQWYQDNKEEERKKGRDYYYENKERHKKMHAKWKANNPDYYKNYMHKYNKENRDQINKRSKPYNRNHYRSNDNYRLRMIIGGRIRRVFNQQRVNKNNTTLDLLGCSFKEAKNHIKDQFKDGMTWELFREGKIHIDHIRPCASFDLTDPKQQKQCFHYSNLQPLWAVDNLRKGAKYVESV